MVKSPEALFELIPQAFSAHAIPGSNRPEVTISGYRPSKDLAVRDDCDFFNTRYPWDRTLISSRDKDDPCQWDCLTSRDDFVE